MADHQYVRCAQCREALSARLDGEQEPWPPETVDRHVASCAACRAWQLRAQRLQTTMIVRPAGSVPDLTATILQRSLVPATGARMSRLVLGGIAVAQCALAFAQLLGLADGMHGGPMNEGLGAGLMVTHLTSESTAWNMAVGIGLLWAALRPRAASGQLPLVIGFIVVLGAASARDLVNGEVTLSRLVTHTLIVLGAVMLYLVHRQHRTEQHPYPAGGDALPADQTESADRTDSAVPGRVWGDRQGPEREAGGYRRPAGEHRAA